MELCSQGQQVLRVSSVDLEIPASFGVALSLQHSSGHPSMYSVVLVCIWVSSLAQGLQCGFGGSQHGFGISSMLSPRSGTHCHGRNRPSTTSWRGRSGSCTRSSTQPGRRGTTMYVWPLAPSSPFPRSGWWEGAGCVQESVFGMLVAVGDCAKSLQMLWSTASPVSHHSIPHGGQKPWKDLKSSFPGQEKEAKA